MQTTLTLTPAIIAALRVLRIYSRPGLGDKCRLTPGEVFKLDTGTVIEPYVAFCTGRTFNTTGAFSYTHSPLDPAQRVGRYCSIAAGVRNFSVKHSIEFVSTSPFNQGDGFYRHALLDRGGDVGRYRAIPYNVGAYEPAVIGHDVWIGEGAVLARNITIGTGAIIGANSVVTRDVPAYAIVAGSPARLIRYRFPETLADSLLRSRWWEYHFADFGGLDYSQPERFVGELRDAVAAGRLRPYMPDQRTLLERLVEALHDAEEPVPEELPASIDKGRIRLQRETQFPVPADCRNWLPAEIDPRDESLFRFFAHRAWLDVPPWDGATHLELRVHFTVTREALGELTVSIGGEPLVLTHQSEDELRRPVLRFLLPPAENNGSCRIELQCDSVYRPSMLKPGSRDERVLSIGIAPPRFVHAAGGAFE